MGAKYYSLSSNVVNPSYDRRCRYSWRANEYFTKGLRFIVSDSGLNTRIARRQLRLVRSSPNMASIVFLLSEYQHISNL